MSGAPFRVAIACPCGKVYFSPRLPKYVLRAAFVMQCKCGNRLDLAIDRTNPPSVSAGGPPGAGIIMEER